MPSTQARCPKWVATPKEMTAHEGLGLPLNQTERPPRGGLSEIRSGVLIRRLQSLPTMTQSDSHNPSFSS